MFYLNAVIWLALGVYTATNITRRYPDGALTAWIIGLLMLGNAGVMLAAGQLLGRRRRWAWYFALAVLVVNIVLTITDQLGWLDFITLAIDLMLFGVLIVSRNLYFTIGGDRRESITH